MCEMHPTETSQCSRRCTEARRAGAPGMARGKGGLPRHRSCVCAPEVRGVAVTVLPHVPASQRCAALRGAARRVSTLQRAAAAPQLPSVPPLFAVSPSPCFHRCLPRGAARRAAIPRRAAGPVRARGGVHDGGKLAERNLTVHQKKHLTAMRRSDPAVGSVTEVKRICDIGSLPAVGSHRQLDLI